MATQRRCPVLIKGVGCGKPATVLDHERTDGGWQAVYICESCARRDYGWSESPGATQPALLPAISQGRQLRDRRR